MIDGRQDEGISETISIKCDVHSDMGPNVPIGGVYVEAAERNTILGVSLLARKRA